MQKPTECLARKAPGYAAFPGIDRPARTGEYVVVRTAGSQSWRLEVSDSDLAVMALFVRDAVGLEPAAAVSPPALDSPVVDLRGILSDRDRADASVQWGSWWAQILDMEFARGIDALASLRAVSDPPEFTALAHASQLRAAVRASFEDASRWRRLRTARLEAALEWDVLKQAVDDVAFDRQVPCPRMQRSGRGAASGWTVVAAYRPGPGSVFRDRGAQRGDQLPNPYDAFDSSLGG